MIKRIRHTGIVVKDLETSLHFYRDLLCLTIIKQSKEFGQYIDNMLAMRDTAVTTVKLATQDGQMIELLEFHTHSENEKSREIFDIGLTHIAFAVDDIDFVYDRLCGEGIPFNAPPQTTPDGYAKVTFCTAPEGTFIELVEVL